MAFNRQVAVMQRQLAVARLELEKADGCLIQAQIQIEKSIESEALLKKKIANLEAQAEADGIASVRHFKVVLSIILS